MRGYHTYKPPRACQTQVQFHEGQPTLGQGYRLVQSTKSDPDLLNTDVIYNLDIRLTRPVEPTDTYMRGVLHFKQWLRHADGNFRL